MSLRFTKDDIPERAFLPIRVDQKPFANLVMRTKDPKVGLIPLSEQTLAAMRKGRLLQVGWLSQEPLQASLAGSDQAVPDLKTCGAQVHAQYQVQAAAKYEAQARADADARTKAIADAQLATAQAQAAQAEAERQKAADLAAKAEADRRLAELAVERQQAQIEADARQRQADADARIQAQAQQAQLDDMRARQQAEEPQYSRYPAYDPYQRDYGQRDYGPRGYGW